MNTEHRRDEPNADRPAEIPRTKGEEPPMVEGSLPSSAPPDGLPKANNFLHRLWGALLRKFFPYLFTVILGLLIFTIFWLHDFPTVDGWYATGRGLAYLRGNWFGIWQVGTQDVVQILHPLSDLLWGLAFALGGGFALLGLLALLQLILLVCLVYLGRSRWHLGGSALLCLTLFLPGLNAPGNLPIGYLLLVLWLLMGAPRSPGMALLVQAIWLFLAPFSWALGLGIATNSKMPAVAKIASGLFALVAIVIDCIDLGRVLLPHFAIEADLWTMFDNLKIVYGLLLLFSLLGALGVARWLSSERAATWNLLFGATRAILVGLLCADAFLGWRVLFPGQAFAGRWGEHAAFAAIASIETTAMPANVPAGKEQPADVTSSAWVHAHALIEPALARMMLIDKREIAEHQSATIWIGSPSPRQAAKDLRESLGAFPCNPRHISGTVAVLSPGPSDDRGALRSILAAGSIEPASEACLILAWFEARRQALGTLNRTRGWQTVLEAILDQGQRKIALAFAQKRNESLAWAMKAEAGLIRFVLELEARGEAAPFVESFRLAQVCHDLRRSLARDPLDGRASNLLEDLLAKQNALDSAVEWDALKAKRRLGQNASYSLAEWRVLDLANELAFYRPLSEGKSMARLRDANRLGLKSLALEELSSSDPVLFGPAGIKLRMELMFSLGYTAEAALLMTELKAARLDRDLGLVEWPYARGKGVAATWKFPAMAWWEASAEVILDSPGVSSPKLNGLIGDLQSDRMELGKRLKENFPLTAGALALPQHGWMPAGYIALQQWENDAELFLLGEQIGKQIQFLESLRRERQALRVTSGPSR